MKRWLRKTFYLGLIILSVKVAFADTPTPVPNEHGTEIYQMEATPTPTETMTESPTVTPTLPRPTRTPKPTPTIILGQGNIDDIILGEGAGGTNRVDIRNFDPYDWIYSFTGIYRRYTALNSHILQVVGGGEGRATYAATGDVDNDGWEDIVYTLGPITSDAQFPNFVMVVNSAINLGMVLGHPFSAFPVSPRLPNTNPVQYNTGELRAAVGDFIQDGHNLLAIAQGLSSLKGLVRLFEYTGDSSPNGWRVVGQFQPLDDRPTLNNANGGVTLAAGDLDGDGLDELLAGQTNSPTSLTQFTVLDIDVTGNQPTRHNFTAFLPGVRGQGGVEMTVADLNGDGINEIVLAGKGTMNTNDPGNWITVVRPVVENGSITGFVRPGGMNPLKVIGDDSLNPGGGLSIAAGEFDGYPDNGQEIVFGSGSGAPNSFFRVLRLEYDPHEGPNGSITSFRYLMGPPLEVNYIQQAFDRGAIFVGARQHRSRSRN